ncbi:hypothetical protein [Mucilaginibacter agri]|uniref:Uncharacterized protein n=1 Tax=Mucilaginibacter agri TaxID=2695265 RepID=A0A965ZLM6_9SPHI|nr:hypothetical protein [Mucilaginibacter agri]NCD71971.1 hypothetical protein [Mucilaginibacter agri]
MSTLPIGTYMEDEKRFEFDFVKHLLKITYYGGARLARTIISPFRMIKNDDHLYLLIHDYDEEGEKKIMIESINPEEMVIHDDNTSYKLQKVK